jgi:hypothetical protein
MDIGKYVLVRCEKIITEPFDSHADAADHAKKVIGAQSASSPIYVLEVKGKIHHERVIIEEKI